MIRKFDGNSFSFGGTHQRHHHIPTLAAPAGDNKRKTMNTPKATILAIAILGAASLAVLTGLWLDGVYTRWKVRSVACECVHEPKQLEYQPITISTQSRPGKTTKSGKVVR